MPLTLNMDSRSFAIQSITLNIMGGGPVVEWALNTKKAPNVQLVRSLASFIRAAASVVVLGKQNAAWATEP